MTLYSVRYRDSFVAYFNTFNEANRFISNCLLVLSYDDVDAGKFTVRKEDFV